jgi:hypothetical protein
MTFKKAGLETNGINGRVINNMYRGYRVLPSTHSPKNGITNQATSSIFSFKKRFEMKNETTAKRTYGGVK